MEERVVLRPMRMDDQEMVMRWRTMPQITRYMSTDSTTDIEEQRAWFLKQDAMVSSYQWVIELNEKPIGVTSITEVNEVDGTCTRGTYVAEQAERSFQMITDIYANQHDFIFEKLNLKKIVIQVFEENKFVVKLNKMCGFKQKKILENYIEKNGKKYNLIELELTREDWKKKKENWHYSKIDIIVKEKNSMDELEKIVKKWCPIYDRNSNKKIFTDGLLDSVGFVAIITDIEDMYGIEIPIEDVSPENFDTIEKMNTMIQKLKG